MFPTGKKSLKRPQSCPQRCSAEKPSRIRQKTLIDGDGWFQRVEISWCANTLSVKGSPCHVVQNVSSHKATHTKTQHRGHSAGAAAAHPQETLRQNKGRDKKQHCIGTFAQPHFTNVMMARWALGGFFHSTAFPLSVMQSDFVVPHTVKNKQNDDGICLMCCPTQANAKSQAVKLRVQPGPRSLQNEMAGLCEMCACIESKNRHFSTSPETCVDASAPPTTQSSVSCGTHKPKKNFKHNSCPFMRKF